jgi:HK97 gp10 family phage protein
MTDQWDAIKRRRGSLKQAILDKEPFQKAAEEWGAETAADAQARAVVDTGAFRDGIGFRVTEDQVSIIGEAPHSRVVEEGSSTHAAQPAIRPAVERNRRKLGELVRKYYKERLKR